jgi:hypothetical protein
VTFLPEKSIQSDSRTALYERGSRCVGVILDGPVWVKGVLSI